MSKLNTFVGVMIILSICFSILVRALQNRLFLFSVLGTVFIFLFLFEVGVLK